MISFIASKTVAVQFVADILLLSEFRSASITIITRGTSEDCSVRIAIDTSLEDTVKTMVLNYFDQRPHISIGFIKTG